MFEVEHIEQISDRRHVHRQVGVGGAHFWIREIVGSVARYRVKALRTCRVSKGRQKVPHRASSHRATAITALPPARSASVSTPSTQTGRLAPRARSKPSLPVQFCHSRRPRTRGTTLCPPIEADGGPVTPSRRKAGLVLCYPDSPVIHELSELRWGEGQAIAGIKLEHRQMRRTL
jgi:hypothetical protein